MKKFYLYFFSLFLISTFAKSDVVGEWEYFGSSDLYKVYLNTHIQTENIVLNYGGSNYYSDSADGIKSTMLLEYNNFQTNNNVRFNYEIRIFNVDCASNKISYEKSFYYNNTSKPYFLNNAIDVLEYPYYMKESFEELGGFERIFKERCNEFYGDQARYIVDQNYLNDSYFEIQNIDDLVNRKINCNLPDRVNFEFSDDFTVEIELFPPDWDYFDNPNTYLFKVDTYTIDDDKYLYTSPYLFQNNQYEEALGVFDGKIERWRRINNGKWELLNLNNECYDSDQYTIDIPPMS